MENSTQTPYYAKVSQVLIAIVALVFILIIGSDIIVPLLFAIIIAILLNPIVSFLQKKGFNNVIAITIVVLFALFVVIGLLSFIGSQLALFTDALPQLKIKFNAMFVDALNWVSQNFNLKKSVIIEWLAEQKKTGASQSTSIVGNTLISISGVLIVLLLLPVYVFLFLYYKPLLLEFIYKAIAKNNHTVVADVLTQTKTLIQSYLMGLLIEACIVATLNSTGLLLLGIDYAILLGVIGALLNLIPYIGGLIAIALPMTLALATKEPVCALYVLGVYMFIQLVDNNFIVPKIVASKVKINALTSIIAVLVGGAIWGVAGMFLSLPITAICKVIFDRVEPLKPFGYLIGDTMPEIKLFKKKL